MKETSTPPQFPLRFFRWYCHPKLRNSIEGDLMELYEERKNKIGKLKADTLFIKDVLLLFRPGIIRPAEGYEQLNNYGMYKSYFKTGWRNLLKSKVHAFINIGGLALGIASVFLMATYVKHELGYDRYYDQHENLYRITWENENPQTRTPHPMAQAMVNDFPEVESAVSLSPLWAAGLTREIFSIRNPENDLRFDESNVLAVDTTFFDVFRFPVLRGDAKKALRNVNGVLISESTAKKYFGDEDPIGKHLAVDTETSVLEVMAVFKDVPDQSHFHFDMLVSYVREKSFDPDDEYYTWADFGHFNYVRLKPGADPKALEAKLMTWVRKYINMSDEYFRRAIANNIGFRVQPVTDIHLKSHLRWELETNGNIEYVYIMAAAALLTLVIACINFMNLMTAKSTDRAKEIGIRKTLGALRRQLSFQFLSESLMVTLIAVVIAVLLVEVSLPFYNSLTGHSFALHYRETVPVLMALSVVVTLLAGIYPSLFLSSIQPYAVLKGKFRGSNKGNRLRSTLIVFQFAISMMLISGAAIIFSQLGYIQNKNLGFDKEEVLVIPVKNSLVSKRIQTLKSELLRVDGVVSVSASSNLPGGQFNQNSVSLVEAPEHEINCSEAFVDYDFLKAMSIELVEGRFFLPENLSDSAASFVINETAARQLNSSSVVGRELHWHAYENDSPVKGRIIGVMEDFHFQSFHHSVQPLIFVLYPAYNHLVIKLNTQDFENKIAQVKNVYAQFDNTFDFEFSFLDERLDQQYKAEQRAGFVFGIFAFIAVAIACFGLFGMAMLAFHQRTKEISIRKVLGASVPGLIVLLLGDFTKLIFLAILMAVPVAWWMMDKWLDNFTYQVGIHPAVFLVSGLVLILVSWITLGYLTLKASHINPAETLKNE
ncbi:MAG: ABC transporter permease [Cyclobacteriaceae bacterium]|nr:ABC transporter permease [Cyclobacteriaceae bacterium]